MSSFCIAKATHIFFSKKFQHICISLDLNFNESLTNDIVSFEQLGPVLLAGKKSLINFLFNIFQNFFFFFFFFFFFLLGALYRRSKFAKFCYDLGKTICLN